jgi:hypothetical protein
MSRTTKNSLSVKELIDILEHPKSKTLTKKSEMLIDRDEVKKQMKLKWKGKDTVTKIPDIAIFNL